MIVYSQIKEFLLFLDATTSRINIKTICYFRFYVEKKHWWKCTSHPHSKLPGHVSEARIRCIIPGNMLHADEEDSIPPRSISESSNVLGKTSTPPPPGPKDPI
jgi:hypothetical protein